MERSNRGQREEATYLLRVLGNTCPSSLRAPLRAVRDGTEVVGTAEDVLEMAIHSITASKLTQGK